MEDHHFISMSDEIGDADNLPAFVREAANLRPSEEVIAWTTANLGPIRKYVCMETYGDLVLIPCLWPALCLTFPCMYND